MSLNKEISRLYYDEKLSASEVAGIVNRSKAFVLVKLRGMAGPRTRSEGSKLRTTTEYREKLSRAQVGEKAYHAKLTEKEVLEIRKVYPKLLGTFNKHQSQLLLAKDYGVKRPTISDIVLNRTWRHI